jgi:hypothetical protein
MWGDADNVKFISTPYQHVSRGDAQLLPVVPDILSFGAATACAAGTVPRLMIDQDVEDGEPLPPPVGRYDAPDAQTGAASALKNRDQLHQPSPALSGVRHRGHKRPFNQQQRQHHHQHHHHRHQPLQQQLARPIAKRVWRRAHAPNEKQHNNGSVSTLVDVDMSQPQPLKRAATCSGGKIRHQTDSCIRAKIDAPSADAKLSVWLTGKIAAIGKITVAQLRMDIMLSKELVCSHSPVT